MPAHNTATSYVGKKLSNGQPVQAHDVVGNDNVDGLAKQVARRDAMPRAQVQSVRDAAERLRDAAIWIGRATAYANHCPLDALVAVDPAAPRQYLRDSEAQRPRRPQACKRKAAPAGAVPEPSAQADGTGPPALPDVTGCSTGAKGCRPATPVATAASVWHQPRAKKARVAQRAEAAREEVQLQAWLSNRTLHASAAPPAAERLAALRARVADRERRAAEAPASLGLNAVDA